MASRACSAAVSWIGFRAAQTASTARPWSPTTACAASYSRPPPQLLWYTTLKQVADVVSIAVVRKYPSEIYDQR